MRIMVLRWAKKEEWDLQGTIIDPCFPCKDHPEHCVKQFKPDWQPHQVFISHRGGKKGFTKLNFAIPLREKLARLGVTAFVNVFDLGPNRNEAQDAQGQIFCALDHCDLVLVLMNAEYFESEYCLGEFKAAKEAQKKVQIVMLEDFDEFSKLKKTKPTDCHLNNDEFNYLRNLATKDTIPFNLNTDSDVLDEIAVSTWNVLRGDGDFFTHFDWIGMFKDRGNSHQALEKYDFLRKNNAPFQQHASPFNSIGAAQAKLKGFTPFFRKWVFDDIRE